MICRIEVRRSPSPSSGPLADPSLPPKSRPINRNRSRRNRFRHRHEPPPRLLHHLGRLNPLPPLPRLLDPPPGLPPLLLPPLERRRHRGPRRTRPGDVRRVDRRPLAPPARRQHLDEGDGRFRAHADGDWGQGQVAGFEWGEGRDPDRVGGGEGAEVDGVLLLGCYLREGGASREGRGRELGELVRWGWTLDLICIVRLLSLFVLRRPTAAIKKKLLLPWASSKFLLPCSCVGFKLSTDTYVDLHVTQVVYNGTGCHRRLLSVSERETPTGPDPT